MRAGLSREGHGEGGAHEQKPRNPQRRPVVSGTEQRDNAWQARNRSIDASGVARSSLSRLRCARSSSLRSRRRSGRQAIRDEPLAYRTVSDHRSPLRQRRIVVSKAGHGQLKETRGMEAST